MAKDTNEVKPPRIPEVGEKLGMLDGWMPSENPHEGRVIDCDDDCAGDCPYCK